jgi:hypothetical protein
MTSVTLGCKSPTYKDIGLKAGEKGGLVDEDW